MNFFCKHKPSKTHARDELLIERNEMDRELKKHRKNTAPSNFSGVSRGAFFMGTPSFPAYYYNNQQKYNKQNFSL